MTERAKDDGGPAFPTTRQMDANDRVLLWESQGMTLRDYFAAHCPLSLHPDRTWKEEAEHRFAYADAMLKERAK